MGDKFGQGMKKFQETGEKLKAETQAKEEKELANREMVKNELAALQQNSVLAKMYADNARVGAENLGGELPLLKVYSVGKSAEVQLADGSEPSDGAFYYKPTGEQFSSITCHILTISRGFRAEGMETDKQTGEKKIIYNQIVGGLIVDGSEYKPFIMYFTGTKLQKLWDFGKEAGKYTHMKPVSIPMFALTVTMRTVKHQTAFGRAWVVEFEIVKDESGFPKLVLDEGEFQFIKDNVATIEDTIASLISIKTVKEEEPAPSPLPVQDSIDGEVVDTDGQLDSNQEEAPF